MTLDDHFDRIVMPAILAYRRAEGGLTEALALQETEGIEDARDEVLRSGRTAAIELHQFADFVFASKPGWLPSTTMTLGEIRSWVQSNFCKFLRNMQTDDIDLLHDVADSLKHAELNLPRSRPRIVASSGAVISLATGYSKMRYGEGKFGGTEQLVVALPDKSTRAMSSILQNCLDAWRSAMGRPLPPIGE